MNDYLGSRMKEYERLSGSKLRASKHSYVFARLDGKVV